MSECIVIGGGVIGLMTARALHKEGVDVLLLERGPLGGESSWAGGGIISPLYPWRYADSVNRLAELSKTLYPELVSQLTEESGIDCELINSGLLMADVDEIEAAQRWAVKWQVEVRQLTSLSAIQQIEPAVASSINNGLWMPAVMQVRNPKIIKALRGSFEKLGIAFREQTPVQNIIVESGRVTGVQAGNEVFGADTVIVAGGAWSAGLIKGAQPVDVEPVKGQMVMFKGEPGLVKRIVLANGHYIIPRSDGHILAGSTLEKSGFDKSTSASALVELRDTAISLVPALGSCPVERQWAGLRPGTQNGIPYICELDDTSGLYVHAGHYRNGIVLGPASVQLMVELVLGRQTFCDPEPYSMTAPH